MSARNRASELAASQLEPIVYSGTDYGSLSLNCKGQRLVCSGLTMFNDSNANLVFTNAYEVVFSWFGVASGVGANTLTISNTSTRMFEADGLVLNTLSCENNTALESFTLTGDVRINVEVALTDNPLLSDLDISPNYIGNEGSGVFNVLTINDCPLTENPFANFTGGVFSEFTLDLQDNSWSATIVDAILVKLAAQVDPEAELSAATINLTGNSAPTAIGLAAKAILEGTGIVVTVAS